jgi:hypothetical protein
LADLQSDEDQAYRKIRLRAEDVQGRNVLTNFWVMMSGSVCTVTIYVVHCVHLHVVCYVANQSLHLVRE